MAEDQQDIPKEEDEIQEAPDERRPPQGGRKSQQEKRSVYKTNEEVEEIQGGQRPQQDRRRVYGGYRKPKCNSRLEELAKPRRWYMLSTWREYGDIFDTNRMLAFKERIQEEFSMSPEETELYFSHLRRQVRRSQRKAALERQLKKEKAAAKQQAYRTFKLLLQQAMEYAFRHPPPPIVSPMIRRMSDTILEQLCEIHHAELPNRNSTEKFSVFLISLADWTAVIVGNIYYEIDVNEKIDIERIRELEQLSRTTVTKEEIKKERSSLPQKQRESKRKDVIEEVDMMEGEEEEDEVQGDGTRHDVSSDDEFHLAYTDEEFTEATSGEDTDTEGPVKNYELGGED